jgi:hypothetical protein
VLAPEQGVLQQNRRLPGGAERIRTSDLLVGAVRSKGWSHAKNAVRDYVRGQAPRVITNRPRHQILDTPLCRTAESSTKRDSSWEQRIDRAQMRQSNLHFWPSRRSGSDDCMPEEGSEKSNHNNAKDKTPRFENRGGVVARGQPVGIAHAKLLGRPPASQPHQTLIKIS